VRADLNNPFLSQENMKKISSVTTVDRLVAVLDSFSAERPAWSLADLSTHLDLPKSTLHRFLTSLEAHGILRRDSDDKRWRLGYRLITWGDLAARVTELRHVARPIMEDLAHSTGEMALLTVYQNQEVVCIDKIETSHSVRLALDVGTRHPPHAGASSKILMAYLSDEKIEQLIRDRGLPRLCTNTITDGHDMVAELEKIKELGYAESVEETDPGAWGVATPIYNRYDEVVAAVGVAGPTLRFTPELSQRYRSQCCEAARRISALLGQQDRTV
jgi:IclR family KDG regulon transcriptional repressor